MLRKSAVVLWWLGFVSGLLGFCTIVVGASGIYVFGAERIFWKIVGAGVAGLFCTAIAFSSTYFMAGKFWSPPRFF